MNELVKKVDINTQLFLDLLKSISHEELNWKRSKNEWSVGQNINHIIRFNESYYPIINSLNKDSLKLSLFSKSGFIVSLFGKIVLKAVQPEEKRKTKTFTLWEPEEINQTHSLIELFKNHHLDLKKLITSCENLIREEAIIHSPANRNVVYKLERAFEIIITHEMRHLKQIITLIQVIKRNRES